MIACDKNQNETLDISNITDYIIMDPFDQTISPNDTIPDTVYYNFKENGKMIKTLNGNYSVDCVYLIRKSNHLFMTIDWEIPKVVVMFGKESNEWEVLKLNSDTMIVDRYYNYDGSKREKIGHYGFKVLKK